MTVIVERIDSPAGLGELRDPWNALLAASDVQHPFLSWEFVTTWWDVYHADQRLCVLVARTTDGTIVGLAPLKIRTRRLVGLQLRTLGLVGDGVDVIVDRLGFITSTDLTNDVIEAFVAWMLAADDVDAFDLSPLAEDVPSTATVIRLLRARGAEIRRRDSVCPTAILPPTWAAFLDSRSRNYRKKFREYERRTASDYGGVVRQSRSAAEATADLDNLASLHRRRWLGQSRAFQSEAYVAFHRRLAVTFHERGWLRMFVMDTPHGPIGALYCLAFGGGYYYYQSGRDPAYAKHRVGLVLMQHALRTAIEEKAGLFDFLRGQEAYKYTWADVDRPNGRILHWKRPSTHALGVAFSALDRVRGFARAARHAWDSEVAASAGHSGDERDEAQGGVP